MVKATAEARIHFGSAGETGSILANITAKCKQEVSVDVTKKLRTLSLKKILFPTKGRRKEKDAAAAAIVAQDDDKRYLEETLSSEKILDTDWEKLVRLPPDIDQKEWLATHTLSFFDHINMIYSSVSEYCTATGCSSMTGPGNTVYPWMDEKGKKFKCAAPQYVEYVMSFAKKTIHDESVFPTKFGNDFPATFDATVKKIHRLLFHVIAHLFQAHYKEMVVLQMHPHLNTIFEHFFTFSRQFSLVEDKQTELLDDLYQKLRAGASIQKDKVIMGGGGGSHGDDTVSPGVTTATTTTTGGVCSEDTATSADTDGNSAHPAPSSGAPAPRPTSLPCAQEYVAMGTTTATSAHAPHHSVNGSATACHHGNSHHDNPHEDNKENVRCDSNQSQSALLATSMATPMST